MTVVHGVLWTCQTIHSNKVLHGRKWIIKAVQQLLPLLVFGRAAKALGVILQGLPLHQQNIAIVLFQAALHAVTDVTGHVRNNALRARKGVFEFCGLVGPHIQQGNFQNHSPTNEQALANIWRFLSLRHWDRILHIRHVASWESVLESLFDKLLSPEIVWVTIPLLVIAAVFGKQMLNRYLSHKERMARIEAGMDPDSPASTPQD